MTIIDLLLGIAGSLGFALGVHLALTATAILERRLK